MTHLTLQTNTTRSGHDKNQQIRPMHFSGIRRHTVKMSGDALYTDIFCRAACVKQWNKTTQNALGPLRAEQGLCPER